MTSTVSRALRAALIALVASTALMAVASPASAAACYSGTADGDFCYTDNGTSATIVQYTGSDTALTIPGTVGGFPVTEIGEFSLVNLHAASVTIPDSVTTIGESAFLFSDLTSVVLGNSVVTIGDSAFDNSDLTSVTIPDSVTTIGAQAFYENALTSATIGNSVTTIGAQAFEANRLATVTIPNSVTTIGNYAFHENQLTSATIPNSVTTIGNYAFAFNNLASVSIPSSLTTISERAFYDNDLTTVTIPTSVTTIGAAAFMGNSLTTVTIPTSVTTIGAEAFRGNDLTTVTIPTSVTTIGDSAFEHNELATVTMEGNEPSTLGATSFGTVVASNDPLVTFHAGATYTHGAAGYWNANGTAYRVQEEAAITFDSTLGTAPAGVATFVGNELADPGDLTADGYRFDGWYDAPTGGTAVTFPLTVTENTTLYAQWTAPTLTTPADVRAGDTFTVTGTGFEPGESVRIELHSAPVVLATVTATRAGTISATVTIPAGTTPGTHSLVLVGSITGATSRDVTIVGALALTGTDPAPLLVGAFGLVGIGLLLRRRTPRTTHSA